MVSKINSDRYTIGATKTINISVLKAQLSISWESSDGYNVEYSGDAYSITATINGFAEGDRTVVYDAITNSELGTDVSVAKPILLKFSHTDVGSYTVTVSASGLKNYQDVSSSKTLAISRKQLTVELGNEGDSLEYNGYDIPVMIGILGFLESDFALINESSVESNIVASDNVSNLEVFKGNNVLFVLFNAHNVGEYSVYLDSDILDGYHVLLDVTFTITPKTVTFVPTQAKLLNPSKELFDGIASTDDYNAVCDVRIYADDNYATPASDFTIPGTYYYVFSTKTNNYVAANEFGSFVIE